MTASTIEQFSKQDRKKAEALLDRVNELLDTTRATQEKLHKNFTEVGVALLEVRSSRAWLCTDAHSWDSYVKGCEERFGRGRTALYGYVSVAERLLPTVGKQKLLDMGITKAQTLASYVKLKGEPPRELIDKASNPNVGVDEFKAAVAVETNPAPEEKGKWWDFLGGCYVTPEEKKELQRAIDMAIRTDPVIKQDLPEWARRKEILWRWAVTYLVTYEAELTAHDNQEVLYMQKP